MKWIATLLLATTLTAVNPSSGDPTPEDVLKYALGSAAIQAIEAKYHEDRSWYLDRFQILSTQHTKRKIDYLVRLEVPSCAHKDLYTPGVPHDDIVTLVVNVFGGIHVVKIEKVY